MSPTMKHNTTQCDTCGKVRFGRKPRGWAPGLSGMDCDTCVSERIPLRVVEYPEIVPLRLTNKRCQRCDFVIEDARTEHTLLTGQVVCSPCFGALETELLGEGGRSV